MIAELLEVELVADAGAERRDDRRELVVAIDLVGPRLFHYATLCYLLISRFYMFSSCFSVSFNSIN